MLLNAHVLLGHHSNGISYLFKYYENIKLNFLFRYITTITQGKLAQVLIDVILFLFLCVVLREQSETEGFDGDYA